MVDSVLKYILWLKLEEKMFQGRSLFSKSKKSGRAEGEESTCASCGGDLFIRRS